VPERRVREHPRYYALGPDGRTPVPRADLFSWAALLEDAEKRRVALTRLDRGVEVSTVFLGIDHRFWDDGPPLLFETMTFAGKNARRLHGRMRRYSTWEEAEAGHRRVVALARRYLRRFGARGTGAGA